MPVVELPDSVANLLQQFAINGAQRQFDGAAQLADLMRNGFSASVSTVGASAIQAIREAGSGATRKDSNNPPGSTVGKA